jgi:glycosyltransferase involved in cell wall biosynthesis
MVPLISVVVPTYNRAHLIPRALSSALGQSHREIELIVVDDGSTDGTAELLARPSDPRIRYIQHEVRRNAAAARNTGIRAASGSFVAFLDSDDEWLPTHLERKLRLLMESPHGGVFGSFRVMRDGRSREHRSDWNGAGSLAEAILSGTADARTSTFLFRREALLGVMFDEELEKHQDWDLAIRIEDRFGLCCDARISVLIHADGPERLSASMNHPATRRFLQRHAERLAGRELAAFYLRLALATLQAEGTTPHFWNYLEDAQLSGGVTGARGRLLLRALSHRQSHSAVLLGLSAYRRIRG